MNDANGLRVVFADDDLVVVEKPSGMPSVPARTPLDPPCIAARLRSRGFEGLEAVHRLDRDTSGLIILARSAAPRAVLGRAFEARRVRKRYEAVVLGMPPRPEGIVHLPVAPDPLRPPRARVDPILGRPATTRWRVLAACSAGNSWSHLELEPVTGRSHQLRVHLAWLGIPILGDRLYGGTRTAAGHPPSAELRLHAAFLGFPHPRDGRWIEISSQPPWWFAARGG